MGDLAWEVVDMALISDIDGTVILAGNSSLDLLAEVGVLEGVNSVAEVRFSLVRG